MNNILPCEYCGHKQTNFLMYFDTEYDENFNIISMKNNFGYKARFNNSNKILTNSLSSTHLLFGCEDGHYFYSSAECKQPKQECDDSLIMSELCDYLNEEEYDPETCFPANKLNPWLLFSITFYFERYDNNYLL